MKPQAEISTPFNLDAEPPYPEHFTVCFSIKYPDWVAHKKTKECTNETPHYISECKCFETKENN